MNNIEAAAKALYKDYDDGKTPMKFPWDSVPEVSRENFRRIAQLVLSAASAPTEASPVELKIGAILHDHQGLDDDLCCKCGIHNEYWWEHVAGTLMSELGLREMPDGSGYYMDPL